MTRRLAAPVVLLLAVLLAVAGCATPTPYQPAWMGDGYGFSEQRIEDNRFRVSFTGNSATPRAVVENYMLYRAAELTLAQGGDYFVIVRRSVTPGYGGGRGVSTGVGVGGGSRSGVGVGVGVGIPLGGRGAPLTASAEILIRKGAKPADTPDAFDARAVRESLRGRILRY